MKRTEGSTGASRDRDWALLAQRAEVGDNGSVIRFRSFAVTFACLAVLASGFMSVAASAFPMGGSTQIGTSSTPCSHCPDCDGMPCPMPAADCVHAPSMPVPALTRTAVDLPAADLSEIHWPHPATILSGLSPPPDPFPPKA